MHVENGFDTTIITSMFFKIRSQFNNLIPGSSDIIWCSDIMNRFLQLTRQKICKSSFSLILYKYKLHYT